MANQQNVRLQSAVKLALATSAFATFGAAQAADTAPSAGIEEVVVTGSRIAVPNEVAISPTIAVTSADIQSYGATRVEDLLNQLPQVFAAQGSTVSNGADGTAQVNLRGLGAGRNLVLVNGRRLGPGDPRGGSASDLNQIPAELIEKVDVMTGGASSVYGADAVSGVVNFQLNTHFEGVKISTSYDFYQHHNDGSGGVTDAVNRFNARYNAGYPLPPSTVNDGQMKDVAFIMGMNSADGKGNVTVYATYRNVASILQSQYDYSACTVASGYATLNAQGKLGAFGCSGSSTSYPGRFWLVDPNTGAFVGGSKTIASDGSLTPYTKRYAYNYGPLNYYQRPDERWTTGAFAHYELNEHADVYTEIMFMNDRSVSQIAPSGAFFGTGPYTVNCSNPYLSPSMVTTWCGSSTAGNALLYIGRRNVEGGGRQDDLEHQNLRVVIGSRGTITDGWTYDAYGQFSYVQLSETYLNDMSITRINNALQAVRDSNGNIVCAGGQPGCVPWNIFQPGGVTPEALKYLQIPLLNRGEVQQKIVSANATGDLGKYGMKFPTAATGVKVNIGAEWREVTSQTLPDVSYQTGDAAGQGSPTLPVGGEIRSTEGFLELHVPIADDQSWAHAMAFDTGYRYSDYSLGFKTNTYKFGLEWSPIKDVRLRGSWARAVRAPNVGELYSSQIIGLDGVTDPCADATTLSQAVCARGNPGVSAGQYGTVPSNPAAQYNGLVGGNPALNPETATTTSFGIGWSPSFVPGFRAQVDWYDINIKNVIGAIGADNILNLCYTQNQYCDRIHRDVNGTLWVAPTGYVYDPASNSGQLHQTGIDLDTSYRLNLASWGKVNFSLVGTYLTKFETTPLSAIPSTAYDCVGLYGPHCGSPNPQWRHTFHATWLTPWRGTDVTLSWRYYGKVKLDLLSNNTNLRAGSGSDADLISSGTVSNTDANLSSRSYFDVSASTKLNDVFSLRVGVNNILDKSPPIVGTTDLAGGNGNTYPGVYDALGRYVFMKLTAQF